MNSLPVPRPDVAHRRQSQENGRLLQAEESDWGSMHSCALTTVQAVPWRRKLSKKAPSAYCTCRSDVPGVSTSACLSDQH